MKLLVDNVSLSLRVSLTVFIALGLWPPRPLAGVTRVLFNIYSFFCFMFVIGIYIIIQVGDLCQVWGDIALMTGTMFLLFTNLSLGIKSINATWRQSTIRAMVEEASRQLSEGLTEEERKVVQKCNRELTTQVFVYHCFSYMTIIGWVGSTEKRELPLRAWYPYDTSKTPAYELTYAHQLVAVVLMAVLNMSLDAMVVTLIAQFRGRLNILSISLRSLCHGLDVTEMGVLNTMHQGIVINRIHKCVRQHQAVLKQVVLLQTCFSLPVLVQFTVSMVIICVTAFQMAVEAESLVFMLAMVAYMTVMLVQVLLYCYHGTQLVTESLKVAEAAYECPWYTLRPSMRRSLLFITLRAQREARLKAGGLTELSLATFMGIIKASYTFFTVLQQVEIDPKG